MPGELASKRVGLVTGADLRRGAPGGTRSYVLGLATFLAGHGVGMTLIANGPAEQVPTECRVESVTPEHLPSALGFQRALRRWSAKKPFAGIGLLHFQRPDDLAAAETAARIPPAICTLHGDPAKAIRRRHGRVMAAEYRRREASSMPHFRALIAVDEGTAHTYRERYPALSSRIRVIPVGVEGRPGPHESTQASDSSGDRTMTFLYAGRLSVEKRVDRIIMAFRQLGPQGKRLIIAGSGPEETRLRSLAQGMDVRFLGNVPHDELMRWYQRADAFVLASEFEGLPTVALESIASGCPVAALAGCGLEAVLDGNRGVIARDEGDLPDAMMKVAMLRKSGNTVELPAKYTWPAVGSRILTLYAEVAPEVIP